MTIADEYPARIWCAMSTYTNGGGQVSVETYWSRVQNDAESPELDWPEYIRADIVTNYLAEILDCIVPCTCIDAYTDRGLIAPDCLYHSSGMEDVEAIVRRVLGSVGDNNG